MAQSPLDILNRFGKAAHTKQQKLNLSKKSDDDFTDEEVHSKEQNPGVNYHPNMKAKANAPMPHSDSDEQPAPTGKKPFTGKQAAAINSKKKNPGMKDGY